VAFFLCINKNPDSFAGMKKVWLFSLFLPVVFFCCKSLQPANISTQTGARILFLAYELEKDSGREEVQTKILDQKLAEGVLRKEEHDAEMKEEDVAVRLLDKKGALILSRVFRDPFYRKVEWNDGTGKLSSKMVYQKKAEIRLREMYSGEMVTVQIDRMDASGKMRRVFSHSISFR
jgi:hypothetical protein